MTKDKKYMKKGQRFMTRQGNIGKIVKVEGKGIRVQYKNRDGKWGESLNMSKTVFGSVLKQYISTKKRATKGLTKNQKRLLHDLFGSGIIRTSSLETMHSMKTIRSLRKRGLVKLHKNNYYYSLTERGEKKILKFK